MKNWQKAKLVMAQIGKYFFIITTSSSLISVLTVLGLFFYVIATQTHNGIPEITEIDRSFLFWSMITTTVVFLLSTVILVKFFESVEKIKITLR